MSKTKLLGIVNVTPDSFSDGGAAFDPKAAVLAVQQCLKDGADIVDIGAESTRPGATPVTPEEEWKRLEPVLKALKSVPFSVDTRHAATAKKSLALGAQWINDVSGFSSPLMVEAVKNSNCKMVVMHALTIPADKLLVMPESVDVVQALLEFGARRIQELQQAGINRERIIFDPGIGFGKSQKQSLAIIQQMKSFDVLGVPLLIGHSRKSFLDAYGGMSRDDATLLLSRFMAGQGVDYLRVHDVVRHRRLLESEEIMAAHG